MASIFTYNILDTVAGAADCNLVNSNIKVTGAPFVNIKQSYSGQLVDPLVEALQVSTLTPTAAASSTYSIVVSQFVPALGKQVVKPFSYVTAASGDTATTICNAFRAMINLDGDLQITATGTATCILTAVTGSPNFTVTLVSLGGGLTQALTVISTAGAAKTVASNVTAITFANNTATVPATSVVVGAGVANGDTLRMTLGAGDNIVWRDGTVSGNGAVVEVVIGSVTTGGAGTGTFKFGALTDARIADVTAILAATVNGTIVAQPARGTYAQLTARGIEGVTSGNIYAEMVMEYNEQSQVNGEPRNKAHSVFINTNDADYASGLRGKILDVLGGLNTGATTANPEASAIG